MTERIVYARFLVVFCTYTQPGEWITASRLSHRIMPRACSKFTKEVSRKLSNLNRFGHLERRLTEDRSRHEYSRPPNQPILLPPELRPLFRFGTLILPDPSFPDIDPKVHKGNNESPRQSGEGQPGRKAEG